MTKKRILIVDDEVTFTRNAKQNLEKMGHYEVTEVNHSRLAVAVGSAFKPDLILLDVMMPVLDGGDVIACVKADPTLKNIPVIVVTANVKIQEIESFGGLIGGYPFLAKPVGVKKLVESIEAALQKKLETTGRRSAKLTLHPEHTLMQLCDGAFPSDRHRVECLSAAGLGFEFRHLLFEFARAADQIWQLR